jgi:hypothetical protein
MCIVNWICNVPTKSELCLYEIHTPESEYVIFIMYHVLKSCMVWFSNHRLELYTVIIVSHILEWDWIGLLNVILIPVIHIFNFFSIWICRKWILKKKGSPKSYHFNFDLFLFWQKQCK